jgi:hypothetical protein
MELEPSVEVRQKINKKKLYNVLFILVLSGIVYFLFFFEQQPYESSTEYSPIVIDGRNDDWIRLFGFMPAVGFDRGVIVYTHQDRENLYLILDFTLSKNINNRIFTVSNCEELEDNQIICGDPITIQLKNNTVISEIDYYQINAKYNPDTKLLELKIPWDSLGVSFSLLKDFPLIYVTELILNSTTKNLESVTIARFRVYSR